ncbi:MAG TPA: hypothetical protein VGM23_06735 [Armatimonadota bacterium]|jgi:hypothetical protein
MFKPAGYCCFVVLCIFGCSLLLGCSSGGDQPSQLTTEQLLARGQAELESVTTNPTINHADARSILRAATRDFSSVLNETPTDARAKLGLALADIFYGYTDLLELSPSFADKIWQNLLLQPGTRSLVNDGPLEVPYRMAQAPRSRSSDMQTAQLRVLSGTLSIMREGLPFLTDVEQAVQNGATLQLRTYLGGRVVTVTFGVADVQLVNAFGNLVTALLNLGVAYNLDMPQNSPLQPIPIDANADGKFSAGEYLLASPFLESFYPSALGSFLQYLRLAAIQAEAGCSLSGHTMGTNALVDVTNPDVQDALEKLQAQASVLKTACVSQVTTNVFFQDGLTRTVNLPGLTQLGSFRPYMPTFQVDNLEDIPGVWPDTTFGGVFTPGLAQDEVVLYYKDLEHAY